MKIKRDKWIRKQWEKMEYLKAIQWDHSNAINFKQEKYFNKYSSKQKFDFDNVITIQYRCQ